MPATTTFCDIKLTEKVENYRYENKDYTWNKGDTVSLPRHTANRFVNKWDKAEWAKEPYEIRDEDYDDVVGRVRNKDEDEDQDTEVCGVEKSDGEVCQRETPCKYHSE